MARFLTIILLLLQVSSSLWAKDDIKESNKKIISIEYLNSLFGHVRVQPSPYSESLSAISCGHPIKLYETIKGDFQYSKVGPYEGYVKREHLSKQKPACLQDRYPKFFEAINLDITEMYYWGKLNDQYIIGKSKFK